MQENYIQRIEEAVCGRDLFSAISDAFRSCLVSEDYSEDVVTPIIITQAQYDELDTPLPETNLYFITDG